MMLEKEIERKFGQWCKKNRIESIKLSSPGRRGVPDRMVLGEDWIGFIEFKRPGGRLSRLQVKTIDTWRELGHDVIVAYSFEEARNFVIEGISAASVSAGRNRTPASGTGCGVISEPWIRKDGDHAAGDTSAAGERSSEEGARAGPVASLLQRVAPGNTKVGKL